MLSHRYGIEPRRRIGDGLLIQPQYLCAILRIELRDVTEQLDVALLGYRLDGPGRPTTLVSGRLPRDGGEGVASDIDADRGFAVGDTVRIVGPDGTLPIRIVGLARDIRFSVQPGVFVSYETFEDASRVKNPDALAVLPSMVVQGVRCETSA